LKIQTVFFYDGLFSIAGSGWKSLKGGASNGGIESDRVEEYRLLKYRNQVDFMLSSAIPIDQGSWREFGLLGLQLSATYAYDCQSQSLA
jgi:hypothetical protein